MSAGSADRNPQVAIAPEIAHISIVRIRTDKARAEAINKGKKLPAFQKQLLSTERLNARQGQHRANSVGL
ncbi:MAG TPA: hypothetical protein V6C91_20120 [Coleofasciculaceae cyanobacterium]